MHAPTLGLGIALLVVFALCAAWFLRRGRHRASPDRFERGQGFGADRPRTMGRSEPGAWRPNSDGRW